MEQITTNSNILLDNKDRAYATGKRKNSIARVWIKRGNGEITINGKKLDKYFSRPVLQMIVNQPLGIINGENGIIRNIIRYSIEDFENQSHKPKMALVREITIHEFVLFDWGSVLSLLWVSGWSFSSKTCCNE